MFVILNIGTEFMQHPYRKFNGSNMNTTPIQQGCGMPTINTSIDLGDHDRDWFIVMCKLGNRSIRANISAVLTYYVRRRKSEYQEVLAYTARKYGLTEDECFQRLLKGESLGNPVEGFTESEPSIANED